MGENNDPWQDSLAVSRSPIGPLASQVDQGDEGALTPLMLSCQMGNEQACRRGSKLRALSVAAFVVADPMSTSILPHARVLVVVSLVVMAFHFGLRIRIRRF